MKILIIQEAGRHKENWQFRESQCLSRAFRRAGHEVICWGNGYTELHIQQIVDLCDAVLCLEQYDSTGWIPVNVLRESKKPVFFWSIDSHCNMENHLKLCQQCSFDMILCSNLRDVPLMQKHCTLAQWLPNAFPSDIIDINPDKKRTVSVGYVGTLGNPARQDMIRCLIESDLLHTDIMVLGDAMVSALGNYKISWNMNVSYDINYRTFESMAAGAMLLTNETSGVKILFDDKVDCVYYSGLNDCIDKIRYYLLHDNERLAIADAGYRNVHTNHSYDKRAEHIIKMFKEFA